MNFKLKKSMLLLAALLLILAITLAYYLFPLAKRDTLIIEYPSRFHASDRNHFEHNPPNHCAGFATAFVLRFNGIESNGESNYKQLSYKLPMSDYVAPKGIIANFKWHGLKSQLFKGNLDSLKSRLVQGKQPLIVLIGRHVRWQHYMVFLAYDDSKTELYFFDSKQTKDSNGSDPGNRSMNEEYFMTLWNNKLPLYQNVYIAIQEK